MRLWSKMVDEGLFEGVAEISFSAMFRERMRNMPEETRERRFRNIGDPRRRDRFMSTYELGVRSPFVIHGIAAYERAFKMLEDTLSETGPWVLGASVSLADINLMPFAARLASGMALATEATYRVCGIGTQRCRRQRDGFRRRRF